MNSESRGRLLPWHLLWSCVSCLTVFYDNWAYNKSEGRGYEGSLTYGGSWKYLTYWNLWLQVIYSILAVIVDVLPHQLRLSGRAWRNLLLMSIILPLPFFVVAVFWGLYFADRDFIHPVALDETIPPSLNHLLHTSVLFCPVLELGQVQLHPRPRRLHCLLALSIFYLIYFSFSFWVYLVSGVWAYQFLNDLPFSGLFTFFSTSFVFLIVFCFFVEAITNSSPRWKNAVIVALVGTCCAILLFDYNYYQTAPFIPFLL